MGWSVTIWGEENGGEVIAGGMYPQDLCLPFDGIGVRHPGMT